MKQSTNHQAATNRSAPVTTPVNAEAIQRLVLRQQAERVTAKLNMPKQIENPVQHAKVV